MMLIEGYEYALGYNGTRETVVEIEEPATGRKREKVYGLPATYLYTDKDGFFSLDSFVEFIKDVVAECTPRYFEEE